MLKELYHGEISPSERKAEPNDRLTQKWLKLSAEFEKTLTAEQMICSINSAICRARTQ